MHTITAANLADASLYCTALDQLRELVPGCVTWSIIYAGGQGGQMTEWPSGRGAVCHGADSEWGDWTGDELTTDDGARYDRSGREIE
jgi:hypothetical protein